MEIAVFKNGRARRSEITRKVVDRENETTGKNIKKVKKGAMKNASRRKGEHNGTTRNSGI